MNRFVTVDRKAPTLPVLLWEEESVGYVWEEGGKAPRVISRHDFVGQVPNLDDLEVYEFEVPTSLAPGSDANQGRYPVVDADGAPLWVGARVEFRLPSYYVNTYADNAEWRGVDQYGGSQLLCDHEHPVYERGGTYSVKRREQYAATNEYMRNGPLSGHRRLGDKLGDPFEHGQVSVHIRLASDPRLACRLVPMTYPAIMR